MTKAAAPKPRTKKTTSKTSPKGEVSLNLILDTAEQLMLAEGYAAVSSRRVAKEAGLKPPLVHYYFPTTDDLYLAVFRRAAAREVAKVDDAFSSANAIEALWATYCNQPHTALAIEFMAMANHRKAIRDEIATLTEKERRRRAEALAQLVDEQKLGEMGRDGLGLNVLLIGVARTLVLESGLGITLGHAEAQQLIKQLLTQLACSDS
ncbi:TetR/AcrR family transcriptional regulator [Halioxenophilus sp. WMMB6]|uniref:TetR/AcrR family transcriptional regulator n=1 Tax=Halioxenophilus sp. WMMB6 TaxID=3073815 RepID=UPI00295E5088|nr:TetR/AcrR family transcriptional regulator [Halioxenophilus sp. WMMB6]